MYTLKNITRRGAPLVTAFAVAVSAVIPAVPAYADALNPLTDRSLTLSSSAPGWDNTDGSGNPTYAVPNSGANGQKTGNTFSFKVSTDTSTGADKVKAMSFQYCTTSAGGCQAPGDNGWTGDAGVDGAAVPNSPTTINNHTSNLEVKTASPAEVGTFATYVDAVGNGNVKTIPARNATGENFVVYYRTGAGVDTLYDTADDTWAQSTGWSMTTVNRETGTQVDKTATGAQNEIRLVKTAGQGFTAGQMVKVVFFATDTNYITNPGLGAFFVRINTFKSDTTFADGDILDGGVTVANVMNQSIQITTKVLETMDFSVGTVDPYTLEAKADAGGNEDETSQLYLANGNVKHGVCDPILGSMDQSTPVTERNRLMLGNELGEFSLETAKTYSTHSYWRLSSNSSAGATVYYAGVTLSNTVGDKIAAIGTAKQAPQVGSEQFGLALANGTTGDFDVNYNVERKAAVGALGGILENGDDNQARGIASGINALGTPSTSGIDASVTDDLISNIDANASWHAPKLFPLVPATNYNQGAGTVNSNYDSGSDPISTAFAFDETSNTIPVPLATQDSQVVDCVTGKIRYIANIAATTPAGIYTTKINYIASPQY